MRFLLKLILIAALAFLLQLFLPWWSVAISAFLVAFALREKPVRRKLFDSRKQSYSLSFLAGFLAIFLLWGISAYITDIQNASILSGKVIAIIRQESEPGNGILLVWITALTGGLTGGLAAMSGGLLGRAVKG
jgi:hypothetical protein